MTETAKIRRTWAEVKFHKAKRLCVRKGTPDAKANLLFDNSSNKSEGSDKNILKSSAQVAVVCDGLLPEPVTNSPATDGLGKGFAPCTPEQARRFIESRRRERLNERIAFRLTTSEYNRKMAEAEKYGISVADWARAAFLAHRLPPARPTAEAIREVLVAFSRVANNLNQITHRANCGLEIGSDLALIRQAMKPVLDRFLKLEGLDP